MEDRFLRPGSIETTALEKLQACCFRAWKNTLVEGNTTISSRHRLLKRHNSARVFIKD